MDRTSSSSHLRPPHPRRPPAHKSVSLLHSPRTNSKSSPPRKEPAGHGKLPSNTDSAAPKDGSTDSSPNNETVHRLTVTKDDSGESSNADKWFDKNNNNATDSNIMDNDPPFFFQNSSSEDKTSEGKTSPQNHQGTSAQLNSLNLRNLQPLDRQMGFGDESSTDEFRGVIDDLTVQNKKLKRKLKRYEMLHDAHLNNEKLFEVRVHGLPVNKKKQLEELLRKFTLDLNGQQDHSYGPDQSHPSALLQQQSSKNSNLADSAYVSASAELSASGQGSGQGSSARSGSATGSRKPFNPSAISRQNVIQNYLHDIPQGLLPSQAPSGMSERTKKKLVVRRLEQIFSGRGAGLDGHHQPEQQQEVSHLAAKADRFARHATGQRTTLEGNREARIMEKDFDENGEQKVTPKEDPSPEHDAQNSNSALKSQSGTAEQDYVEKSPSGNSPDQRPTRPLDLDPQRAQVPDENIKYMRHLGFSPPDVDSISSPEEGHGWIYLNLLINMAQLHTINVTPEFVKSALEEYSTRFELSNDGRKVRWVKPRGIIRKNRENSSSNLDSPQYGQSPRKRVKSVLEGDQPHLFAKQSFLRDKDRLSYTPMFSQRSSEDSDISSSEDEELTGSSPQLLGGGQSSGVRVSSGSRTRLGAPAAASPRKIRKRQNGPIIFYNKANFCTDLSGDNKTEAAMIYNPILYHVANTQPVGAGKDINSERPMLEKKGPLNDAEHLPEAMDLSDNPIPPAMEIDFPAQTPMTSGSEHSPFNMEVSGLGGVYPADNFSINVRTKHSSAEQGTPKSARSQTRSGRPNRVASLLMENSKPRKGRPAVRRVISTRQRDLPPSELPPASCFISIDGSDSEDDYEESALSIAPEELGDEVPRTAPQPIRMESWSSDDSNAESDDEIDDDEDDEQSEASLDFLATAREIDPESIRAREREYDANLAERLAEDIPAGSSAATAGGGSGFASPVSDSGTDEEAKPKEGAPVPSFRRARTEDSMVVNESP